MMIDHDMPTVIGRIEMDMMIIDGRICITITDGMMTITMITEEIIVENGCDNDRN